jgi:hypothetical protein
MLTHIVMWKFQDYAAGADKETNLLLARERLLSLKHRIPDIQEWIVRLNVTSHPQAYDVVLVSTFADGAALARYQEHPLHQEVVQFLRAVQSGRSFVDYET